MKGGGGDAGDRHAQKIYALRGQDDVVNQLRQNRQRGPDPNWPIGTTFSVEFSKLGCLAVADRSTNQEKLRLESVVKQRELEIEDEPKLAPADLWCAHQGIADRNPSLCLALLVCLCRMPRCANPFCRCLIDMGIGMVLLL